MARLSASIAITLLLGTTAHTALAAPVPVANADFEALYFGSNLPAQYAGDVPPGAFPTGPPPADWTAYYELGTPQGGEFLGVLNPGTTADYMGGMPCFPAGAPQGDNMLLLYQDGDVGGTPYGVTQVLTTDLEADTVYTLSVDVGNIQSCAGLVAPFQNFFDLGGFPGYRVQLLADGVVLVEDAGLLTPGEGLVETTTLVYPSGSGPIAPGQMLEIRLINENDPDVPGVSGLEVDFDDVRLDATPVAAVPIGRGVAWALAGLLLTTGALSARALRTRRARTG